MGKKRLAVLKAILFLSLNLCLILAGCAPTSTRSSLLLPDQPIPPHLKNQPAPAWRAPLHAAEVKESFLLDEDTLLLSTMNVTGFMQVWGLADQEIVLMDINEGTVLWRFPCSELKSTILGAAATADRVVVTGIAEKVYGIRVTAIDRSTGKKVWGQDSPPGSDFAFGPKHGRLYVSSLTDSSLDIKSLDMSDGTVKWDRSLARDILRESSPKYSILPVSGGLLVAGSKVLRLDPVSGKTLWEAGLEETLQPLTSAKLVDGGLLLYGNGGFVMLSYERGSASWSRASLENRIIDYNLRAGSLFILEQDREGKNLISRLDPATGKASWRLRLQEKVWSRLFINNGKLYFTTRKGLFSVDSDTGKGTRKAELPAFMHSDFGLADKLTAHGSNVVVARETGVAGFLEDGLKILYAQAVQGEDLFAFNYASRRYILRQVAKSDGAARAGVYTAATGAFRDQIVMQQTGKPAELTSHVGYGSGFEVAAQAAHLAASMVAVGAGFREFAVSENMRINKLQILSSQKCQDLSIQHGYYIRPFHKNGWGLTLVRLSDGARADFLVSQPNEPLRVNSANMPLFLVDPERKRVLVNGIGINPDPNDTYRKVGFGKDVYKSWPGIPSTWIIPYASVFAYDLDGLRMELPGSRALPPAPPVLSDQNNKLREAILNNNLEEAERLIKTGADVNSIDQLGFNALFYAALIDDKKMVRMLIDRGADATLRDPSGLMAYHYTFLTHAMNRTTGIIRSAHLEQTKEKGQ